MKRSRESKTQESFIDVKEAAEFIGVPVSSIYNYVASDNIPYYKLGRLLRFRKSDLTKWVRKFKC